MSLLTSSPALTVDPVALFALPSTLALETITIEDRTLTMCVASTSARATCPQCGTAGARILRDGVCAGRTIVLRLCVRKWLCVLPACPQRIFAEQFPDLVQPYGRMTARTTQLLQTIGVTISGADAARVLAAMGVPTSANTIIRRVLRLPLPPEPAVTAVGIDEWAWKKGHHYGTLLVDLEQHRLLALLPERSVGSATTWFQCHAEITVVSRDRGTIFREAAQAGAPQAIQVADRFHLQKNLAEAIAGFVGQHTTHLRTAARRCTGVTTKPPAPPVTSPERRARHQRHRQQRAVHRQVWTLHRAGHRKEAIAQQVGISSRTVYRLLADDTPPPPRTRTRTRSRSLITPYLPYLSDRWNQGCRVAAQVYAELRERGYRGSHRTVQRHIQALRPHRTQPMTPHTSTMARPPSVTAAALMLVRPATKRTTEQTMFLDYLQDTDPAIKQVRGLVEAFGTLLREQGGAERLAAWQAEVRASGITALVKFVDGLVADANAVAHGCSLPWSNGVVEGFVNKIKAIKRSSYGQAGFALLQRRVLLHPG